MRTVWAIGNDWHRFRTRDEARRFKRKHKISGDLWHLSRDINNLINTAIDDDDIEYSVAPDGSYYDPDRPRKIAL